MTTCAILVLQLACTRSRYKTYRCVSTQVIDKKLPEEEAKFNQEKSETLSRYDSINTKIARGEKLTTADLYNKIGMDIDLKHPENLIFHPEKILLPSSMVPAWIEINSDFIIFEGEDKQELRKFKIESINKQEGIDDAEWYFRIDDPEIKTAILFDDVLQFKSDNYGHYDYTYSFYMKKKNKA